jgi:predicted O-methyltransferase YrrM
MMQLVKKWVKNTLRYAPLPETKSVRVAIASAARGGLPYCPDYEGDLIFSIIREGDFRRCLETGFHTGSTALYMTEAVSDRDGTVVSICLDDDETVARGSRLLQAAGHGEFHRLIRENSNTVLPELFRRGEKFDLIFMDGWKTFDHLAFEMYFFNQLLVTKGAIVFDDAGLPSVRKAIRLLKSHYGYVEVDYAAHGQTRRLRLLQIIMTGSFHRPYRALEKAIETSRQAPFMDWTFYSRV